MIQMLNALNNDYVDYDFPVSEMRESHSPQVWNHGKEPIGTIVMRGDTLQLVIIPFGMEPWKGMRNDRSRSVPDMPWQISLSPPKLGTKRKNASQPSRSIPSERSERRVMREGRVLASIIN
jgi:hypothetical protein